LAAAEDLHAKRLFPIHSTKFSLTPHAWDAPLKAIAALHTSGSWQNRIDAPLPGSILSCPG
jgi:hypothetical protein